VSVVHKAGRPVALSRLRQLKTRAVPSAICCIVLLAGCGGNDDTKQRADDLPQPTVAPLRLAECTDWRKGSVEQRQGTVIQIREFAGGPVGSSQGIQRGRVLDDAQAYQILDRTCSKGYARGFRLYALYTRAAAFASHPRNARPFGRVPEPKNPSGY
jgi:hypothetical protein